MIDPEDIKKEIKSFFKDLYSTEDKETQEEMVVLSDVVPNLIKEDNRFMTQPVSLDKVRKTSLVHAPR